MDRLPLPLDTILHGDCLEVLRTLPDASVDAVVTDPPAGIAFMGKDWDAFRRRHNPNDVGRENVFGRTSRTSPHSYGESDRGYFIETMTAIFAECLRVLKPGGHALVWALPRTSHWTGMALEDAGFEVREKLAHWFGSGFPKSHNLHGEYEGWGTALKPAYEDWWLCRKPLAEGTVAANVLAHGTGALNIDACRVGTDGEKITPNVRDTRQAGEGWTRPWMEDRAKDERRQVAAYERMQQAGRWPPHLLLSHSLFCSDADGCHESCPVAELDRQSGVRKSAKSNGKKAGTGFHGNWGAIDWPGYGDTGGASRYFPQFRYVAKASRRERGEGNTHPTVKPLDLMRWLCRLITPPGGLVLDPFAGSGTTGVAALSEGFHFLGIEREAEYVAIIEARLAHVQREMRSVTPPQRRRKSA